MPEIMDRLYESLTALDRVIRRQRRAIATIDALDNMSRLELARYHMRQAQIVLARVEGDALPPEIPTSPQTGAAV